MVSVEKGFSWPTALSWRAATALGGWLDTPGRKWLRDLSAIALADLPCNALSVIVPEDRPLFKEQMMKRIEGKLSLRERQALNVDLGGQVRRRAARESTPFGHPGRALWGCRRTDQDVTPGTRYFGSKVLH